MLVGAYPFGDPDDPKNFRTTICRILSVQYMIPDSIEISLECKHLLYRIFVANPEKVESHTSGQSRFVSKMVMEYFPIFNDRIRITIKEIQMHPWFLKNLPTDIMGDASSNNNTHSNDTNQTVDEILSIIQEARTRLAPLNDGSAQLLGDSTDFDDLDGSDIEDMDMSDDYGCSL
ncbi:putative non-specific serine/threonine protein kinase [Helianthus annuus]|nr:putative non-specific serine/threonine protein kinase [Helianthus annuus]